MDVDFIKYKFEDSYDGVITKEKFKLGLRHVQTFYMCACSVIVGISRGCGGVAVIAMTDSNRADDTYIQIFNWDNKIQGAMLSFFFWGYAMMYVPAEIFMQRISGKMLMAVFLICNGLLYLLLPTIANKGGWMAVCNVQFIMGALQTLISPANCILINKWLPPNEKKMFSWLIYGIQIGIIISFPIFAAISTARLGWELVFYTMAMIDLSAGVIWVTLTAGSPEHHPAVGDKEKEFIQSARESFKKNNFQNPWRDILRTPSFWSLAIAHVANNIVFVFFVSILPMYLVKITSLSIEVVINYAAFPFAVFIFIFIMTAPTFEWINNIGLVSYFVNTTHFRKILNTFGAFGIILGLGLMSTRTAQDSLVTTTVIISVALAASSFQMSGFLENHKDMTQHFSGTLLVMTSAVANVFGALVPIFVGFILEDHSMDQLRWRTICLSLSFIVFVCNAVYVCFGDACVQHWDITDKTAMFGYTNDIGQIEMELLNEKEKKEFGNLNDH